jgi:hypothetical protein
MITKKVERARKKRRSSRRANRDVLRDESAGAAGTS